MDNRRINLHSSILQVASIIKNKEKTKTTEQTNVRTRKKRERSANYSKVEINKLVDLAILKKDIIENRNINLDSNQKKQDAWDEIEKEFNKNLGKDDVYRDKKTLHIKLQGAKKCVKQRWHNYLEESNKSSAKKPKFSSAEKKILDFLLEPMEGFCDFQVNDEDITNVSDSDDMSIVSGDIETDYDKNAKVKEEEIIFEEIREPDIIAEEDITNNECSNGFEEIQNLKQDPLVRKLTDQRASKSDLDSEAMKKRLEIEILKEELEIKKLQKKMLEQEMQHKMAIHELEKTNLLLKLKVLKD